MNTIKDLLALMEEHDFDFSHGNIRRGSYYLEGLPDWEFLNKALPERIRMSDLDGIVEVRGHFLIIEYKRVGVGVPDGQAVVFNRLYDAYATILVIEHENHEPVFGYLWDPKIPPDPRPLDRGLLQDFVRDWASSAKDNMRLRDWRHDRDRTFRDLYFEAASGCVKEKTLKRASRSIEADEKQRVWREGVRQRFEKALDSFTRED